MVNLSVWRWWWRMNVILVVCGVVFGFWLGSLAGEGDEGKMMVAREIEIDGEVIFQHSLGQQ